MLVRKFVFGIFLFCFVLVSVSCVSAESFGDVQSAIDGASNTTADVVYLNNGSYDGNGSVISIRKNVTLDGASVDSPDSFSTLDAHSLGQIVNVVKGNVTFKNLIFKNGNSSSGGAVYGTGLVFINCVFIGNNASQGGAISGNGNNIVNSSFVNNSANHGGAIMGTSNVIVNSSFVNCSVRYNGGAVNGNNQSIVGSSFVNCSANQYGGAVYGNGAIVGGCSFVGNSAKDYGGAINGRDSVISNSTFNNNSAKQGGAIIGINTIINNSSFVNNSATQYGGVISGSNAIVDNSSFVGNSANTGGAIYGKNASISTSSFVNNSANYGGAISGTGAVVGNSSFVGNAAKKYGGAISGTGAVVGNSSFVGNAAKEYGGAIKGNNVSVNGSSFVSNSANRSGGAISGDNAIVGDSRFNNNSANEYGGAINGNDAVIDNSSFVNNSVNQGGGAIYGDNIKINDSSFVSNSAKSHGGAIYSINLTVVGSEFVDNHANLYGGAINQFFDSPLSISSSNFTGNNAMYGGAVNNGEGSLNIDNSSFADNNALFYGGAIATQGNITIKDSLLNNNDADKGNDIFLCNVSNNMINAINTNIPKNNVQNWNNSFSFRFNDSEIPSYCTEPSVAVVAGNMSKINNTTNIYNKYDGTPIGEYLKILVYNNINNPDMEGIVSRGTYIFSSPNYLDSEEWYIKDVLNLYDSGFRVADHAVLPFNDTHMVVFDFFELFSTANQNRFAYNYSFIDVEKNITVNKTTSNKTVHVGNQVIFNISVTNNGNIGLDDVYVVESKYDGFKYVGFVDKSGLWIHSIKDSKHMWSLNKTLAVGETLGFSVLFDAVDVGNLTNLVIAGFGNLTVNGTETVEVNNTTSNNTTNTTNKTNKTNNITSNKTKHNEFKKNVVHSTRLYNTGNPLFLSVLALISICLVSLRRRK